MNPTTIGIIIGSVALAIFIISLLINGLRLVRQAEVYIIERLGRYHKTLESGLNFIIPVFDKSRKIAWRYPITDTKGRTLYITKETAAIDLRETVLDFPRQNVITKDNVGIEIDALLYFQVTDPKKAVYEINNLPDAIERLTQTTLRNVLGEMDLDASLSSREVINNKLRIILDEATDKWGVKVNRVELKDISPPQDVKEAMEKQMKAERNRRAQILEAEGLKRAAILKAEGEQEALIEKAEGEKKSAILKAEGVAKSKRMIAEAEGEAIMKIVQTTGEPLTMDKYLIAVRYIIANNYLQSLKDISEGKQTKTVFLPYEASGVLSSIGTMKELFKEQNA